MRIREILQEDYNEQLLSDLNNLLVGAKGSGDNQIITRNLVKQLYDMGYSVDQNSIMPLLSQCPVVTTATPQSITLSAPEGASGEGGPEEDSATKVADMARQASEKQGK